MVLASVNIPAWQNMGANQAYFMWCTGKTQAYVFEYISMQKYLWQKVNLKTSSKNIHETNMEVHIERFLHWESWIILCLGISTSSRLQMTLLFKKEEKTFLITSDIARTK